MKILYIGINDELARQFLERMHKEDYEVFFLAPNNFQRKERKNADYKYYRLSENAESIAQILASIHPEYIVYSGFEYMNEIWKVENNSSLTILNHIMENCVLHKPKKIIYLSSFEIYGNMAGIIDEESKINPVSVRGVIEAEGEYLMQIYNMRNDLPVSVIRASQLYSSACEENKHDFLSNIYRLVNENSTVKIEQNKILYPLHAGDLVDAIKRVIETEKNGIYHFAGSSGITRQRITELMAQRLGKTVEINSLTEEVSCKYNISKSLNQLEWIDFKKLEELLQKDEILFIKSKDLGKKSKHRNFPAELRKTIENAVVFLAFFAGYFYSKEHILFSQIDWMLIYVSTISLFMGIRQSALAVALASLGSLFVLDLSIFEMTNFYSYAEALLMIIQFVFLGISISYSADMIKEKLRESQRKQEMIEEELAELKEINEQNIKIKNEYEKRILDSKMSITQLYSIVNKIMVLSPERVFMEVLQVVSDVIETNTVAIYMQNGQNPYLRLLNSLNEESTMGGKSWNISENEQIQKALDEGNMYQGNVWNKEPSVIIPIARQKKGLAVLVIKTLSYEQQTLYHINLLRTIMLLIKDAVEKAMAYEILMKADMYLDDTGILISKYFINMVEIAEEKQEKNNAEYSIIEIETAGDLKQAYFKADNFFRTTDYFGTDAQGKLYVLLGNTGKQEREFVIQRLEKSGIIARENVAFDERI